MKSPLHAYQTLLPVLLAVALMTGCAQDGGRAAAGGGSGSPKGGKTGSALVTSTTRVTFADLDEIHAEVASHRGRPVFINFWATWCVPCLEELPGLATMNRRYESGGPVFIGVSFDAWVTGEGGATEALVQEALAQAGVEYTNLIYTGNQDQILSGFDLPGSLPYSILLDDRGRRAAEWGEIVVAATLREAVAALP